MPLIYCQLGGYMLPTTKKREPGNLQISMAPNVTVPPVATQKATDALEFQVMDYDTIGSDDLLGPGDLVNKNTTSKS